MPARINSSFWSAPKHSIDFQPFTINPADVTAGAGGIIAGAALWGIKEYVESQINKSGSSDEILGQIVHKNTSSAIIESPKFETKPVENPSSSLNFLPNTNLLNILANQNQILQILCFGLLASSSNILQKKFEDTQIPFEKNKAESDKQAMVQRENLYNQPFTIKGRVETDPKTGYWLDPITRKFYDPITGDRIADNSLASAQTNTNTSANVGHGSAVSADVNFKEVLKSQVNINSEISKYISTIGENQKIYNQNLIKVAENSAKLIDSTKGYSQAIRDGLAGVKLNANVDVNNRVNASLSVDRPVEVTLPTSYIENQKILSDNSTKTLEIYKEKAEYDKTSVAIKDLDGNTITKASPREIALSRQAVQARTYTDENNFELDNEALDLFDLPMPNFKDLFDTELPSKTLLKDMK